MNPWINGKRIASPCKNCPDRWVTETDRCHGHCEKYLKFHRERTTELCIAYEEKNKDLALDSYSRDLMMKYKLKKLRGDDQKMRKKVK